MGRKTEFWKYSSDDISVLTVPVMTSGRRDFKLESLKLIAYFLVTGKRGDSAIFRSKSFTDAII